jgi:N-acyl-D-aspartate/D-glutamate deacylase
MNSMAEVLTRDEAMFRERLAGKSIRNIAAEFGCDPIMVQDTIARMCQSVTTQMKLHGGRTRVRTPRRANGCVS